MLLEGREWDPLCAAGVEDIHTDAVAVFEAEEVGLTAGGWMPPGQSVIGRAPWMDARGGIGGRPSGVSNYR